MNTTPRYPPRQLRWDTRLTDPWKAVRFEVTLSVPHHGYVETVTVTAYTPTGTRRQEFDSVASKDIGPFDDVRELILTLMTEAAATLPEQLTID